MPVPTFEDLFEAAKREAITRPTRLTPEIFETEGSDVNIAMAAGAAMAESVAAYAQGEINSVRLSTAPSVSDEALDRYGASELGETRSGALSAIVPCVFVREPSLTSTAVSRGTLVATGGGVTFLTTADLLFQAGQIGPLTVPGLATTAGPGGNVGANTITRILSPVDDPTMTVSNPEPAAGGRDGQTTEEFAAQLGTAYQRARKATVVAIEEDAAIVDGVASARSYELLDGDAQTGRVVVQILGNGGTSNSALAARVRSALRSTRAAGVPVIVIAMSPLLVTIRAYGLLVDPSFDEAEVLGQAARSIVAFVDALQVGAKLYRAQILSVLASTPGLSVPDGALATPATDIVPGDGEYVATRSSLVLVTKDAAP